MSSRLALLVGWLLLALPLHVSGAPRVPLFLDDVGAAVVTQGVEVLVEEPGVALSREQVMDPTLAARWRTHEGRRIEPTRERTPLWIRFAVENRTHHDDWVLAVGTPMLRNVVLHQFDHQRRQWREPLQAVLGRAGDRHASSDPAFAFALDARTHAPSTVLLQVVPMTMPIVLTLSDAATWRAERGNAAALVGVLFGVLGAMLLYNLSLQWFTGDRSYAWYTAYLLAVIAYELAGTGFGPLYLWGDNDWLKTHAYESSASACFLFAALFMWQFLDLKRCGLSHVRVLVAVLIGFWMFAVPWSLMPGPYFVDTARALGAASVLVATYAAVRLAWRGNVAAAYFALAWMVLLVGTVAMMLSLQGLTEGNLLADYGQHIGFALETVLLSVALADRIRRERRAKNLARREALQLAQTLQQEREQKLLAQEHALAVQREANEALEQRVQERTAALERANEALGQLSTTDALTQLHNRRYFDQMLAREIERSAQGGEPLALLLVDIDHFKQINDCHGHLAGDAGLKLVAQALRDSAARSTDLVARYGGEEFALVLPGTDATQALEVAERARRAVQAIACTSRGETIALRVSIGVLARSARRGESAADFIACTDAALYRAKSGGRDRVVLADGMATPA